MCTAYLGATAFVGFGAGPEAAGWWRDHHRPGLK